MTINAAEIINALGGTAKVAQMFNIKMPSVSNWKQKNMIPKARLMYLQVKYPHLFRQLNTFKGQDHGEIV